MGIHKVAANPNFCTFGKIYAMLAVAGIYDNGRIKLDEKVTFKKPLRVIITFLEENNTPAGKHLALSDFSFAASRKVTEGYKGSFTDTLIEERRSEL